MARPPTIKDEQIIEAAREVFLARGIRATTAEVAERAGISEGSIFNRFKSKVDLFRAALKTQLEAEPDWARSLSARLTAPDIRAELVDLGLAVIEFFRTITPLLMMSWSNPSPEGIPCHLAAPNPLPLRAVERLARYFAAEIEAGRLRRVDAEILARIYLGGLQSYVFFEILLKLSDQVPQSPEAFVRTHVELLWSGVAPAADQPAQRAREAQS